MQTLGILPTVSKTGMTDQACTHLFTSPLAVFTPQHPGDRKERVGRWTYLSKGGARLALAEKPCILYRVLVTEDEGGAWDQGWVSRGFSNPWI